MKEKPTPEPWNYACDSYGKVRHSRKAAVYTVVKRETGEEIVNIAQRIGNWDDARLIVTACNAVKEINAEAPITAAEAMPELVQAVELALIYIEDGAPNTAAERLRAAFAKIRAQV